MRRIALLVLALTVANSTGAQSPDSNTSRIIEEWTAFTSALQQAGTQILEQSSTRDDIDAAEANLYLVQQLSAAIAQEFDEYRIDTPLLRVGATTIHKWGLDSSEAKYQGAAIESSGLYRLSGTLGSAQITSIQSVMSADTFISYASIDQTQLQTNTNGEFELVIGLSKPEDWQGPFLQLQPTSNRLLIREYFGDWPNEAPSTLLLERLDTAHPPPPMTMEKSAELMQAIAKRFERRAPFWNGWVQNSRSQLKNQLRLLVGNQQGLSNNAYGDGWFDIADDEALLIELEPPKAQMWSFQLGNYWWESIEYITGFGSINSFQAHTDSDGIIRLVIAKQDPGILNWLDTGGHNEGSVMYRFQNTTSSPTPTATLVKLDELTALLPADTALATAQDREQARTKRRQHIQRRWAP